MQDPDVVNNVIAPDAVYVSLNTESAELNKILPWAGTSHGPQAVLDSLKAIFSRWENQAFNVTAMFGDEENVGGAELQYKSNSLGKVVTSPFSIHVRVTDAKVTYVQFLEGHVCDGQELPQGEAWTVQTKPDPTPFVV